MNLAMTGKHDLDEVNSSARTMSTSVNRDCREAIRSKTRRHCDVSLKHRLSRCCSFGENDAFLVHIRAK